MKATPITAEQYQRDELPKDWNTDTLEDILKHSEQPQQDEKYTYADTSHNIQTNLASDIEAANPLVKTTTHSDNCSETDNRVDDSQKSLVQAKDEEIKASRYALEK